MVGIVLEIIKKKITDLSHDPSNVRTHNEKNITAIKASLRKFGQQKPIVIDDKGTVIAGNGTLESAKSLGWTEIDCVVTELDSLNKTAFAIADNRTAELADWDKEALELQLDSLLLNGFDVDLLHFDLPEVSEQDLPNLPEGERDLKTTQITFTVGIDQKETIENAINKSKELYSNSFEAYENTNSSGNAIYEICKLF